MAKLDSYKGSVDLISGLRAKNNGNFPLMQAHDIQVDEDGTRLDEKLENMGDVFATHIRYSAYADGTDFTDTWSAGFNYIGFALAEEAPTDKAEYEWSLFASNIRETTTVTLTVDGWADNMQTVSISSIGDNSSVFCTPHPESNDVYIDAGVILDSATESSLMFKCVQQPADDVLVNIQIVEPLIDCDGESSGVKSWNDLEDRPFYDESEQVTIKLEDQSLYNITTKVNTGSWHTKVSNNTPNLSELLGGTMTYYDISFEEFETGETGMSFDVTITDDMVLYHEEGKILVLATDYDFYGYPQIIVCYEENVQYEEGVFTQTGVYFGYYASADTKSLTYSVTNIHKLDEKYLPGSIYGTNNTVMLTASNWLDGVYTLIMNDMGEKDAVFFTPSTRADKTALEDADVFISANGQTVTFEAETTPETDIALNYFIVRGR